MSINEAIIKLIKLGYDLTNIVDLDEPHNTRRDTAIRGYDFIKNSTLYILGVNCYGNKPRMTEREAELMETASLYPITQKEILFNKRVKHWRHKLHQILVAPFNHQNWSVL